MPHSLLVLSILAVGHCGQAGNPTPTQPGTPSASPPAAASGWLSTARNQIVTSAGTPWMGRGVNIFDTRSCNACSYEPPSAAEVKRRIDEAVAWGANFFRLTLESYSASGGRVHWKGVLDDSAYVAELQEIVRHVASKPGVYVMLSLWVDPTLDANGWPTADTVAVWRRLADVFKAEPRVMFGVANEPAANFDGSRDATVWEAMNRVVEAIRAAEDSAGAPNHLVSVQGTRQWARVLDYYVQRPIAAKAGINVVYETHVYDPSDTFQRRFEDPSRQLPVVIGEFGPVDEPGVSLMTLDDCDRLIARAEALGVSYLAWTFHMRCSPDLLQDLSGGGCGIGMSLRPTAWGELLRARLLRYSQ